MIGGEIKNGKSWGGKVKENVEDRLLERGKKALDKLELIKNQPDTKNTYRPILNKKSMALAGKTKKLENLGNWGSLVKFQTLTPSSEWGLPPFKATDNLSPLKIFSSAKSSIALRIGSPNKRT